VTLPTSVDLDQVSRLVRLSIAGLEAMYDPSRELLLTRRLGQRPERSEHLALRYAVMSAAGLGRAVAAGFETTLDPARLLESGLMQHQGHDLDHLGMALWADAVLGAGLAERILPRLLPQLERSSHLERRVGRELAWTLTGLSLAAAAGGDPGLREAARRLRDFALTRCWSEQGGLFAHWARAQPLKRAVSLFSTQIYWIYALATWGRLFDDPEALRIAGRAMDTLQAGQDRFGGWAWRYAVASGAVTERYPVYSVHQDGMAPMALRGLRQATGRNIEATLARSMSWLRTNQLGVPMADEAAGVIYRGVRRRFPLNRAFMYAGHLAALATLPGPGEQPWALRLNATCRPYHLGWVLYAWAERAPSVTGSPA